MSSSVHVNNKKKYILILRKGPAQELEHTLTAEKMYSINFTVKKKIAWACITIEEKATCLLMVPIFTNLKQKILRL